MPSYADQLKAVDMAEQKLVAKRFRLIEKAAKSDNPTDMIIASQEIAKIQQKPNVDAKAYLIDPLQFTANLGYKDKLFSLTYTTLRRMAKTPIINSIIKTRKNQIADFAEPQADRYNTGFVIRKKPIGGVEQKMDNEDRKIANAITDFILNCGSSSSWTGDDFDTFIRKIVEDSLTFDQMTFECVRNRRGKLEYFLATDASTFRMAESAFKSDYDNSFFHRNGAGVFANESLRDLNKQIHGYYPQYVQVYQNAVVNEFYPWELCFGVRNPSTWVEANGYGCSELEDLINVVTSLLWGDEYNRRFFSQGSAPKGLLRIKSGMNEKALQQFKQQWQAMISGVMQSWKTPVVEADVDWIDLQKNNRDMEYNAWMEYLIKLACAIYSIDPTEIGWDISRSAGNSGLYEASQAERLQHSKDKGLYPILKFIQRKINKYIVEQINPDYEFVFMGLNGMTIEKELEMDIKKIGSFATVNEIREKWDMKKLDETGDIIENSVYFQAYNQKKQAEMQKQQREQMGGGFGNMGGEEENGEDENWNPFDEYEEKENGGEEDENPFDEYEENEEGGEGENPFDEYETEEKADDNVFVKAFENYLQQEVNNK